MHFDTIVLGAGINGLSASYHLLRRGVKSLALVEQHTLGHHLGSSHGMSRITRSSYSSAKYVEMIQVAHSQEWPRLAKEAGKSFLHPTPGCFFGPGNGAYLESVQAVPEIADRVEILGKAEARQAFPCFAFPDSVQVIKDHTCAVVSAAETIGWLGETVGREATVLEQHKVTEVCRTPAEIRLRTERGELTCGRLVVTAGGWLRQLFPQFAPKLQVAHQDVGYFEIEGADKVPVWVYCPAQGDSFYGLPEFRRPGIKVARHRTGPEGDDPDRPIAREMPEHVREELEGFVRAQFTSSAKVVGYEACLYTNTVREDFILDHHPEDKRIVIGSACSGHGFKFGPLSGRILAGLLLDGKSDVEPFERYRREFSVLSQGEWN